MQQFTDSVHAVYGLRTRGLQKPYKMFTTRLQGLTKGLQGNYRIRDSLFSRRLIVRQALG